jgi:hypothetical protein
VEGDTQQSKQATASEGNTATNPVHSNNPEMKLIRSMLE